MATQGKVSNEGRRGLLHYLFNVGYGSIVFLFTGAGFCLVGFAATELWSGVIPGGDMPVRDRLNAILLEEELLRQAHISAPTRTPVPVPVHGWGGCRIVDRVSGGDL